MNKKRIYWGAVFILAAVFLVIGKLGFLGNFSVFSILLTIFMITIIIASIKPLHFSGILFPVAILCIIYEKPLHIESLTPWTVLLVALLGSIGLSILFHNKKYHWIGHSKSDWDYEADIIDVEDSDHIKQKVSFAGCTKYVHSDNFKQADFECSFGSMQVYYDKAQVPSGNAVTRISCSFGGIELYIPKTWAVENHIDCMLGAVEEKNSNYPDGSVVMQLVGEVSFSGIEIIYV